MALRFDINDAETVERSDAEDDQGFVCRRHLLRRTPRRRSRIHRAILAVRTLVASFLVVVVLAITCAFVLLRHGPIIVDLKPQIIAALNDRVGAGYHFDFGRSAVEATDEGPALMLDRLSVTDAGGRPIVTAPRAAIAVSPMALILGRIAPTRLDIHDVDIRLLILPDGQVAVSAGTDDAAAIPLARAFAGVATAVPSAAAPLGATAPPSAPRPPAGLSSPPEPANAALKALSAAMRSLVDAATTQDGPLNALQQVKVTGRLVLDDRTQGAKTTFEHAVLGFDRETDGAAVLAVTADGPSGRWSVKARAATAESGTRTLSVDAKDLSLDEITLAGGLRSIGFDFDMPVSAHVDVALGTDGAIDTIGGRFDLGTGYFKLDDPDHEPMLIDDIAGGFHLDRASRSIIIDETVLKAGNTRFATTGQVDLPTGADDAWRIRIATSGVFGAERPGEKPIAISSATFASRYVPASHRFLLDTAQVTGPEVDFDATADIGANGPDVYIKNTSSVRHMPAQVVIRLWPSFVAASARAWLLANLKGGTIDGGTVTANLDANDVRLMHAEKPVADDHVRVAFDVSNLALNVMSGIPPLTAIDASGVMTGRTFTLTVRHGELDVAPGRRLTLADGTFTIPDNEPKPMPAAVEAHVVGGVDVLAELLSRDALKSYAGVPLDPASVRGQFNGHLTLGLRIGKDVPPGDAKIGVDATATNLAIDKLFGKEGLTDAGIKLDLDKGVLHAKGEGRILGAPATLDFRKPATGQGEAVVAMTLDEAARARAGLTAGGAVKGIVAARITAPVAPGEKTKAAVDLDFTRASIDGVVPGFSKPIGRPAKANLTVIPRDNGVALDDVAFDGGGAVVRGAIDLTKTGDFAAARFSQVKLSPGDDMKVDVQQVGDILKMTARGANLDGRPFLKWFGAPASGGGGEIGKGGGIDLELHSGILTGQNSQAMTGVDLRVTRRSGRIVRATLTGRLGRQPVSVTTAEIDNAPHFIVHVDDAGAGLLFMDLYKRMAGGRLDANVVMAGSRLDGYVTVHDFTLREDPALTKLTVEGLASQQRDSPGAGVDPSALHFIKLEANFSKTGNEVEVRDGSMFGPVLGATVSGRIDFARDQVNLGGTFVPLFGVNNLFSQVPVVGSLLGGGRHEGLLGLSYTISGSAAKPVLHVNPFTALTPGFFRQIFGAIDPSQLIGGAARDQASGPLRSAAPAAPTDSAGPVE